MYASVIVNADAPGLSRAFTYRVPDELVNTAKPGVCVAVPFSGREMVGYIMELTEDAPENVTIKALSAVVTEACVLNPELLRLATWISRYYSSPLAFAVRAIVPEVMSASVSTSVRLINPEAVHDKSPAQQKLVTTLAELGGEVDSDILKVRSGMDKFIATLRQLKNRGAVQVIRNLELPKAKPLIIDAIQMAEYDDMALPDGFLDRAPRQASILEELSGSKKPIRQSDLLKKAGGSSSSVRALIDKGLAEKVKVRVRRQPFKSREAAPSTRHTLTRSQEDALRIISEGLDSDTPQTTLLYGVTGSGKTEVYMHSMQKVLDKGLDCIALVPEISLTAHLMDVYKARFGDRIAIIHSKLSTGERYDEWRRIESGEARVVLGARSAVFAPVRNLGLIVVDEEHEPSYKQDHSPRYNARLAAEERAREEDASVILGSATPSIETFYRASSGEIKMAVLDKRIEGRPMPEVRTVDLRKEFAAGRRNLFSKPLHEAIQERLDRHEQVILFVNRRGYASFVLCRTCGYTPKCENCDISLTYHNAPRKLLHCHHCDETHPVPTVCPQCGGEHIKQFGIGTEKVEEETQKLFPDARIIRMDADTTRKKNAHVKLLDTFREGEADILIGTQMVAKGLDFPNVTLVGVISADTSLHLPDFRAAERTFQLMTQVGGRGGRGELPGETIIQTFSPDHYAIRAAARQDFLGFYGQEIAFRKELSYPPFSRLVNIVSSDPVNEYAETRLEEIANAVRERVSDDSLQIVGPAPAPIARLKGLYRWHLLIKNMDCVSDDLIQDQLNGILGELPSDIRNGLVIDVDPLTML